VISQLSLLFRKASWWGLIDENAERLSHGILLNVRGPRHSACRSDRSNINV
jgi:hypothetical protein